MALLLITHNLGLVRQICDKAVVMYAGSVLESSPSRALFENPLHPYTAGLLNSIPRLRGERGQRLASIEGYPPVNRPPGCVFSTRCGKKIPELCEKEAPVMKEMEEGHSVRCFLYS